jgi:hypothetical protein
LQAHVLHLVRRIHKEVADGQALPEQRPGLEIGEADLHALVVSDGRVWVEALKIGVLGLLVQKPLHQRLGALLVVQVEMLVREAKDHAAVVVTFVCDVL